MRKPIETWIVDFYDANNKLLAKKEVKRANAPTRWADNYMLTLRRRFAGVTVTYSIERIG